MSVPVAPWRTRVPRQNSCAMVPRTNALNAKQSPEAHTRTPSTTTVTPTTSAHAPGTRNESRRLISVDLRHAVSGPYPVRNSNRRPIGSIHLLKKGGPTVRRSPVTASLSVGNIVAKRTNSAANSRIQLLMRNAASREDHESSSFRERRRGSR